MTIIVRMAIPCNLPPQTLSLLILRTHLRQIGLSGHSDCRCSMFFALIGPFQGRVSTGNEAQDTFAANASDKGTDRKAMVRS